MLSAMHTRVLLVLGLSVLSAGALAALPGTERPIPEVVTETVALTDIDHVLEFPARISGSREIEIRAQVSGILQARTYEEGSQVSKGQVLFRIDPRTYEAALARAKAALAQEQARYRQAERNLARIQQMQSKGFASGSELDNALSNYEQSRANIEAAKAEVQSRQIDLDYTTVRAPIAGITRQETRSEGSLVVAGDPSSSLLTHITQLDPVYLNFAYPDQVLERLRDDLQQGRLQAPSDGTFNVELQLNNGQSYVHSGRVDFTDSLISRGTGTVSARAVVPNPDQTLLPGQFVRARVKGLTYRQVLSVPERAVTQTAAGTAVFVVDENNHARLQPVSTGPTVKGRWLIWEGIRVGESVIVEGLAKVEPGVAVKVLSAAVENAL